MCDKPGTRARAESLRRESIVLENTRGEKNVKDKRRLRLVAVITLRQATLLTLTFIIRDKFKDLGKRFVEFFFSFLSFIILFSICPVVRAQTRFQTEPADDARVPAHRLAYI